MTPRETAALLAHLGAAYPNSTLADGTASIWAKELEHVHPDDARHAMHAIEGTLTFFPSLAEFRQACHGFAVRRRMVESRDRGLQVGEQDRPVDGEIGRARAQALRAGLRAVAEEKESAS